MRENKGQETFPKIRHGIYWSLNRGVNVCSAILIRRSVQYPSLYLVSSCELSLWMGDPHATVGEGCWGSAGLDVLGDEALEKFVPFESQERMAIPSSHCQIAENPRAGCGLWTMLGCSSLLSKYSCGHIYYTCGPPQVFLSCFEVCVH